MNRHKGGSLDAFLEEEGILDEISTRAKKRLLTLQPADILKQEFHPSPKRTKILSTNDLAAIRLAEHS